jgi:subtilisin family serine protease
LTYQQWRAETYSIDQMAVVNSVTQSSVQANWTLSSQLIGLDKALADFPYRGAGCSVAIIDTGIDANNPAFAGRVIAGWNFVNNSANYLDDNGHGTGVAGIIGSSDPTDLGVAPGVNLIALKVLDATGSGTFGAVADALNWVITHQAQYNIVAVNMSLGVGDYTTNPYTFLDNSFQALQNEAVFVAVASGNDYFPDNSRPGLAFPAISPLVVSVGAVWDGNFGTVKWVNGAIDYSTAPDQITSFTERSSALDLLAPGAMITSIAVGSGYQVMAGTSMATPFAAGAAVLLHQELVAVGKQNQANQAGILVLLQNAGVTVVDSAANNNVSPTGLSFKRLNLDAAMQAIAGTTSSAPVLDAVLDQTTPNNQPLVVTLSGHDADGDALTYSAQILGNNSQAYQLKQQLGLSYAGSYFTNSWGAQEKWLLGTSQQWYFILPDGELRKWAGTITDSMTSSNLLANLDPSFYADPSLLWNAQPGTAPNVTLIIAGNQLTIQALSGYTGSFVVQAAVSDGSASASQSFTVTVVAATVALTLDTPANQTLKAGTSLLVNLSAHGGAGPLTYSAKVSNSNSLAYQLKQQLGLVYPGSYFTNSWGYQEKWLLGANEQWYFLLPNGQLRRWAGSMSASLSAGALVANLGSAYYVNPSSLWNAKPATAITVSLKGNQLTIHAPTGAKGTFMVQVTVSDGVSMVTKSFTVTVQ